MIEINKDLISDLFAKAEASERKRMNYDLRTSAEDGSQRMLNALLPGTEVPIHRHPNSNENVLLLCGKLVEVIYEASPKSSPKGKDFGIHTADPMWYDMLKKFAEENRKNPTEAEGVLWKMLKANGIGYKFRQQHIIEDFIVDFYCNELKLTIELDGGYHNRPEQMKSDAERTERLKELGYTEIRFTNEQALFDTDNTLAHIKDVCDKLKASPFRGRLVEASRYLLDPSVGNFGCVVPAGAWHTVEVLEPSVIYEAKDGKYGEDGSESLESLSPEPSPKGKGKELETPPLGRGLG